MARIAALVVVLGSTLALAASPVASGAATKVLYVSPRGDNAGSGSRAAPFGTLERARSAVRRIDRRASGVEVRLLGGVYRLREPLRLDARDSGTAGHEVVWRAAPGAHPVLSGGVRVREWSLYDAGKRIYRARVGRLRSRQLYVNRRRAVRARSEPNPPGFTKYSDGYAIADPAMASWRNPSAIEVVSNVQWKSYRCPVAAITAQQMVMRYACWHDANLFPDEPQQIRDFSIGPVSWIENAYELLDKPREWYLDDRAGWLYYIPGPRERMSAADVELPVAQKLLVARGTTTHPIRHVRFEGLTFSDATWMATSGPTGYADDQTGFHVVNGDQPPNQGHAPLTVPTPGNVSIGNAQRLTFERNRFVHLGAVGLDLMLGSQETNVVGNHFEDISGAGVQVSDTSYLAARPALPGQLVRDNRVANNVVTRAAREYLSAPGIMVGFATRTTVSHNELSDLPYSGIALGWGWGLMDPGHFIGYSGAEHDAWPVFDTPTSSQGNRVLDNRIRRFLLTLWDGGAVYTTGFQGTSMENGELIAGNVASGRGPGGGQVFYTDGGSRYVTLRENVAYDNPPGTAKVAGTTLPYGADWGGCRPYGDISFESNYFQYPSNPPFANYEVCPYPPYPVDVSMNDTQISGPADVPRRILDGAGLEPRFRDIRR
jgi:hypothetical protein